MRSLSCFLPLSLLIFSMGCTKPDTHVADEAAIRALDEEWSKTAGKLDVDGTVAYYSDDAWVLPPNEPLAKTKADIRKSWAALLAPGNSISWAIAKVEVVGDMGYSTGSYDLSIKVPDGAPITDKGKFLEVWKRQADGKWKCVADAYNSDMPLPAPAPAPEVKKKK